MEDLEKSSAIVNDFLRGRDVMDRDTVAKSLALIVLCDRGGEITKLRSRIVARARQISEDTPLSDVTNFVAWLKAVLDVVKGRCLKLLPPRQGRRLSRAIVFLESSCARYQALEKQLRIRALPRAGVRIRP